MKKNPAFLLLLLSVICIHQKLSSQAAYSTELHHLMQTEGAEVQIQNFFNNYLQDPKSEYTCIILLPPMTCSRCEGLINPFISSVRKSDTLTKIVLVVFYPRNKAVEKYLSMRNFHADLIIVMNDHAFLENFHINTNELQVPFILKFRTATAELVFSRSTLGMSMDNELVKEFHEAEKPLPRYEKDRVSGEQQNVPVQIVQKSGNLETLPILKPCKRYILEENEAHPISSIDYLKIDEESHYLSFMDDLSYEIYIYKLEDTFAEFHAALSPTTAEDKLFISDQISDTLYLFLKSSNILNSMYFSSSIIGDSVVIAASLPRLFFEDTAMENLAYFNQISYIYKDLKNSDFIKCILPENIPDSLIFTLDHLNTHFLNGKMYIPLRKGWPDAGTEILKTEDTLINPFIEPFYDKIPLMAVFTNSGEFIRYIGKLEEHYKVKRLGYYYNRNYIDEYDHSLWFSDAWGGKIFQYAEDGETILSAYRIFELNDSTSPVDYKRDPLGYMLDYRNIYTSVILSFRVTEEGIYSFVKDGEHYKCLHHSFDGRQLLNDYIPDQLGEMKFVTARLIKNESSVRLMAVYETARLTAIYDFTL